MTRTTSVGLFVGTVVLLCIPANPDSAAGDKPEKAIDAKAAAGTFVYPGARRFWDEYGGAGIYSARFTSNDDFRKVSAWYKARVEFDGVEGISVNRGMMPGIRTSVVDNSRRPGPSDREQGEKRPVEVTVCFRKTNELIVNAVITREKGERETYIVLTIVDTKRQ